MANVDPNLLYGNGMQPTITSAPTATSTPNAVTGSISVQPHHGVIGLVIIAVIVLWALDKFGFRFAVTVGRSR